MLYPLSELQQFRAEFVNEIRKAQATSTAETDATETADFTYLRHRIPATVESREFQNHRFQVIAIGGSTFHSALATRTPEGELTLSKDQKTNIPQILTKEQLFILIEKYLEPDVEFIGLNFAYPLEPISTGSQLQDCELIKSTKEHHFAGLVGKAVGAELATFIEARTKRSGRERKLKVAVANDTVCLNLSGLGEAESPTQVAAGIVGTGSNFSIVITNEQGSHEVVNLETGNFTKFNQTESGKFVDAESKDPGEQLLEKELAGGYLYQHFNYYREKNSLQVNRLSSSADLGKLKFSEINSEAGNLAAKLIERSAQLVAMEITSLRDYIQSDRGGENNELGEHNQLVVVMEGSLFWKGPQYSEYVMKWLTELGCGPSEVRITQVSNSSLVGAAALIP